MVLSHRFRLVDRKMPTIFLLVPFEWFWTICRLMRNSTIDINANEHRRSHQITALYVYVDVGICFHSLRLLPLDKRVRVCMRVCVCVQKARGRQIELNNHCKQTELTSSICNTHLCTKIKMSKSIFCCLFFGKKVDQLVCLTIVSSNLMTNLIYWDAVEYFQNIFLQFNFNWNMARSFYLLEWGFYTNCAFLLS